MSIININTANLKDHKKFLQYVTSAALLMKEHDVEVVSRGSFISTDGEQHEHDVVAIFRFSSMSAVKDFYESERYIKLIELRDKACYMTINIYEEIL